MSHFSVSLDYGCDSPLSVDQINFSSLKDKPIPVDETEEVRVSGSLSFQEAVGKASNAVRATS